MSIPANILSRRREEGRREEASRAVADLGRVTSAVLFASRGTARFAKQLTQTRVSEANARLRAEVDARRARLAQLLEAEKAQCERDIEASFETPEQVKERCVACGGWECGSERPRSAAAPSPRPQALCTRAAAQGGARGAASGARGRARGAAVPRVQRPAAQAHERSSRRAHRPGPHRAAAGELRAASLPVT